jgi:pimeloyl-ACP methyl ester carboxylesterase
MTPILRSSLISALLVLPLLTACVSVKPLAEIHSSSADDLLHIADSTVHIEQAGEGDPVLLIHGFGASTYSWREVMPALAEKYRVVAIDLYGFGWTERPDDWSRYTRDGQVELILDVMDALDIERAHLVGHSYGGSISMALAADHPDRVRSMVLVDAAAVDYPMNRRKWFAGVALFNFIYVRGLALRAGTVERVMGQAYYDDSLATNELVGAYLERLRVEGAAHGFRGLTRPLPADQRPRDDIRYEDLDVPTLVLWGAQDQLITIEVGRYHTSLFPNARFVAIEGAGHSPMEEKPAEFVQLVTAFIEEIEGLQSGIGVAASAAR